MCVKKVIYSIFYGQLVLYYNLNKQYVYYKTVWVVRLILRKRMWLKKAKMCGPYMNYNYTVQRLIDNMLWNRIHVL